MRVMLQPFLVLFLSMVAATASDRLMGPFRAIQKFGGIAVSDGSSYYTFSKDGSFESGPLGMSGRTMKGRWVKDADGRLIATARLGWINGISSGVEYRRIAFFLSDVYKPAKPVKPLFGHSAELFDCYFFIDEMRSIPKPSEADPK